MTLLKNESTSKACVDKPLEGGGLDDLSSVWRVLAYGATPGCYSQPAVLIAGKRQIPTTALFDHSVNGDGTVRKHGVGVGPEHLFISLRKQRSDKTNLVPAWVAF